MAKKDKKVQKFNPNPGTSTFDGGAFAYLGWQLWLGFGSLISLFIATPWIECAYYRWVAKHTKINGKTVVFDGKGGQLFWKNVGWFFATIFTLGIFSFWLPVKKQKWIMKHSYVEETTANACYPTYPAMPQQPQHCAQQPAPYYGQYYYPCAPVYPQNGCCRYYR